ncbi:hypothetical protein EES37_20645 [Streptomyces sp. ADI91-18]|nr:hypothetical protein EES37_20645 [Streptomyces sp. ADI91-18]
MQPEQGGVGGLSVRRLGLDLGVRRLVGHPGGAHAPEGGTVFQSRVGEPGVQVLDGQGGGAGRRPALGGERRLGRADGEDAVGVPGPGPFGGVGVGSGRVGGRLGAGVHAEGAAAGRVGGAHPQLQLDAAGRGQHERGVQGEFFEEVAADLVAGADGELDEGAAGQHGRTHDGVVGEPGVGVEREPAGAEESVEVGEGDGGAEQRVAGGSQTGGGDVAEGAPGVEPERLALEGVRGQVDAAGAGAGVVGVPVDGAAADVQPREGARQGFGAGAAGAQYGQEGGRVGVVGEAVLGEGRQDGVRADFEEVDDAPAGEGADAVEEADGVADVPDPEVGRAHLVGDEGAGQVRDDRYTGGGERQPRHHLAEVVEHAVHVRRVERVAHRQPLGLAVRERLRDGDRRLLVTRDDHRARAVDGRDAHAVGQHRQDLLLGGLHRDHHATGRQRLHEAAARGDQRAGVGQREDARDVRGGDLTDRVTGEEVRLHAPGLQQPEQGHFDREEGGLRVLRTVQELRVRPEQDLLERQFEVQPLADRVQRGREGREGLVQLAPHAEALAALTGEQERQFPGRRAAEGDARGGDARGRSVRVERGEGLQCAEQSGLVRGGEDRPVLEVGAPADERVGDVPCAQAGVGAQVRTQFRGLGAQRCRGLGGEVPQRRHGGGDGGCLTGVRPGCGLGLGGLFDDGVGVGAADAERGDARAARRAGLGPRHGLGEQPDGAFGPVDVRGGFVHVQGLGQDPVAHRHDHLDDPGDARGGLGVPEVGLDGAEQQRPAVGAVLAVGGQQRLRLDGVAEGRARAVGLDGVDLGGREPGPGEGLADDALLGGPVGGGEAAAGAVLVHGRAADHGEDGVAVLAGDGEPFQDEHAGALAPAGAVGGVGEGLAAAVAGQSAVAAELGEGAGRRHDGDTAGEGEGALAAAQGLGGEVDGDERGRAGRVDGDGRALQAEGVGDAAGGDAAGAAVTEEALDLLGDAEQPGGVVVVHEPREDAGAAAAQRGRVDAGPLEGLPGGLQEEPLLGVHGEGLARGDPEEGRVEVVGVVEESADLLVRLDAAVGVGVEEDLGGPAPVGGVRRDGVGAVGDQLPQAFGGVDATGVAAAHRHDRDRLLVPLLHLAQPSPCLAEIGRRPLEVIEVLLLVHHSLRHPRGRSRRSRRSVQGREARQGRPAHLRTGRVRRRAGRRARRPWRPGCPALRRRCPVHCACRSTSPVGRAGGW